MRPADFAAALVAGLLWLGVTAWLALDAITEPLTR